MKFKIILNAFFNIKIFIIKLYIINNELLIIIYYIIIYYIINYNYLYLSIINVIKTLHNTRHQASLVIILFCI